MKRSLNRKETVFVASMLFGMFFGAGNLIFPVSMGQLSGSNMWQAAAGFLITGVGLPLLGVAALGISREDGLMGLSSRVGRRYGKFFTCILYLTIGPFLPYPDVLQSRIRWAWNGSSRIVCRQLCWQYSRFCFLPQCCSFRCVRERY